MFESGCDRRLARNLELAADTETHTSFLRIQSPADSVTAVERRRQVEVAVVVRLGSLSVAGRLAVSLNMIEMIYQQMIHSVQIEKT